MVSPLCVHHTGGALWKHGATVKLDEIGVALRLPSSSVRPREGPLIVEEESPTKRIEESES